MLHILAKAEGFAGYGELLLDRFEGGDNARWAVGAEEVPCVETGEVLESAEKLVAANCRAKEDVRNAICVRIVEIMNEPVVATKRR